MEGPQITEPGLKHGSFSFQMRIPHLESEVPLNPCCLTLEQSLSAWIVGVTVGYSISTSGCKKSANLLPLEGQLIFIGGIAVQNHFLK